MFSVIIIINIITGINIHSFPFSCQKSEQKNNEKNEKISKHRQQNPKIIFMRKSA